MLVERTNSEVVVRLSSSIDADDLQDFLNYARYKEITSKFTMPQKEVDKLAKGINKSWWAENKKRFIK